MHTDLCIDMHKGIIYIDMHEDACLNAHFFECIDPCMDIYERCI